MYTVKHNKTHLAYISGTAFSSACLKLLMFENKVSVFKKKFEFPYLGN